MAVTVASGLALLGCTATGTEVVRASRPTAGVGADADLPARATDHLDVRAVVPAGSRAAEADGTADADRLDSPFGGYSVLVGSLDAADAQEVLDALAEARYIDLGNVAYDLANPDLEVVLLQGATELCRLGYYTHLGTWGEDEVPGRWVDADWELLDVTVELPAAVVADG